MKLFSPDSKFMRAMSMLGDLMLLNFVFLLCCVPVITLGIAFTAMNDVVIRLLRQEGRTMIVVTHEMGFAREASDRVAFLSGGTVAERGTPKEIFESPKTEALQRFLRE